MLLLCVAQANPPLLAGRIDCLRSGSCKFKACILCYCLIIRNGDDNRSPSPKRVFVNVKLVAR